MQGSVGEGAGVRYRVTTAPPRRGLGKASKAFKNWVGKSSDFTNPFVCGPAGGKVKKMSSSSALSHMSTTIHIPNFGNLRASSRGVVCHICRQRYTYSISGKSNPI